MLIGPLMRLLMPMILPSRSNSGPPESPPISGQSVCTPRSSAWRIAADADHGRATRLLSQRMSQGDAPRAGLEIGRLAQLGERVLALVGDLHQTGVRALEDAETDALVGLAVVGDEGGLLAGLDGDVAGGDHQPVLAHDHAAAPRRADLDADRTGQNLRHDRADLRLDRPEFGGVLRRFDARDGFRVLGSSSASSAGAIAARTAKTTKHRNQPRRIAAG